MKVGDIVRATAKFSEDIAQGGEYQVSGTATLIGMPCISITGKPKWYPANFFTLVSTPKFPQVLRSLISEANYGVAKHVGKKAIWALSEASHHQPRSPRNRTCLNRYFAEEDRIVDKWGTRATEGIKK